ncbi:hypothetical protein SLEP1_g13821 [Rubroshorea leprosula]|uniref:Myb-like domain-containing protein n=1 Tax=Rubroshorea leprosula TaxID=152421 RepID=A0AAV5IN71_9ROSI|nr:hypothetical protein SLEP1_g13821 [Rubroshorea leprosula]
MGKKTSGKKDHKDKGESNKDGEANSFKEGMNAVKASAGNGDGDSNVSSIDSEKIKNREELRDDCIELSAADKEAVVEGDVNRFNREKKDRKKKRKLELHKDEKESQKAGKKHKKIKVGEKEEASKGTAADRVDNITVENNKKKLSENNFEFEGKQDRKKRHKKNKNEEDTDVMETLESNEDSAGNKTGSIDVIDFDKREENKDKKKKKKKKKKKETKSGRGDKEVAETKKTIKSTDQSENPMPKERSRKVSFADHVEVFPSAGDETETNKNGEPPSGDKTETNKNGENMLVQGKRFSKEEDEILKEAVSNYIELRGLGEPGLNMILNCQSHPEVRNCWKEIGAALPWRPISSVYHRVHILFERDENRKWSAEEYEMVLKFVEKNGTKWKTLAGALGKHRTHVKDTWRRIKLPNRKKGRWSQEEYQTLFDLVNMDLSMKATMEKKSKHGMLRDNVCWGAISDMLATRGFSTCCVKWYDQLASPMVAEGKWADADDYRLLDALSSLDACCMEDVEWDSLLEHRSGEICRKRWSQMVQHIGHHGSQSFAEQVEILAARYRPDMVEAREAFDNKPYVDQP